MSEMADIANVIEIQSNTAPEKEMDMTRRAQKDTSSQLPLVMTEGDDSVFYSEEEEIPQPTLDSIWAPHPGEPNWPDKLNSAPQIHNSGGQSSSHGTGLMDASSEIDTVAMPKEMENKMENKVNNVSSTDADVHGETAANSRITQKEELSTSPVVPLTVSAPAIAAQIEERAETYEDESSSFLPDESGETGVSNESLEEEEQEHGLDLACESDGKPFDHLAHAKFGTVSYRKIRKGQTRKRIEMFESMMQL